MAGPRPDCGGDDNRKGDEMTKHEKKEVARWVAWGLGLAITIGITYGAVQRIPDIEARGHKNEKDIAAIQPVLQQILDSTKRLEDFAINKGSK